MSEDGLSNKALHRRAAVVAAGPLASLLLAGAVYGSSFAIFGEGTLRGIESENSTIVVASLLTEFSFFVALFSLIPIPPLDGGWLAFFGIEALTGKPIPERIQKKLCTLGMAMLVFVTIISAFAVAT
jgi:membrane-associated protease RseP (regulator of RpoE activity)